MAVADREDHLEALFDCAVSIRSNIPRCAAIALAQVNSSAGPHHRPSRKNITRNHYPLGFGGAFINGGDPRIPEVTFHVEITYEAVAAMNL